MNSPFCAKDVIDSLEAQKRTRRRKRKASHHDDARSSDSSGDSSKMKTKKESKRMLPIGYFNGTTVFRNCLHPEEKLQDGFLSLSDLIPPDWSHALATTFCAPEAFEWVESVLENVSNPKRPQQQFILVHHGPHPIGEAKLAPIRIRRRQKNGWYTLSCQPHTGGCMHPKILLFRTRVGLRVIVSGNNFYQYQWENDRDCFWAQDFILEEQQRCNGEKQDDALFPLKSFLSDLCQCQDGRCQTFMDHHLNALFDQVSLSSAKASLVFSFPRAKEDPSDRGGWKQLTRIVQDRMLDDYDTENDSNSPNTPTACENINKSVLYAMSGSTGDVDPTFLTTMKSAMSGQDTYLDNHISWQSITNIQCLIPSYETAQTMNPVWNGRLISRSHWYSNIPKEARQRLFNDAIPNPNTTTSPLLPFAHAKVMFYLPKQTSNDTAVLYVGSHNFSKAAWGVADKMPTNIEVGVVLSTVDTQLKAEWECRLPYSLPQSQVPSDKEYTPLFQGDFKRSVDPALTTADSTTSSS